MEPSCSDLSFLHSTFSPQSSSTSLTGSPQSSLHTAAITSSPHALHPWHQTKTVKTHLKPLHSPTSSELSFPVCCLPYPDVILPPFCVSSTLSFSGVFVLALATSQSPRDPPAAPPLAVPGDTSQTSSYLFKLLLIHLVSCFLLIVCLLVFI